MNKNRIVTFYILLFFVIKNNCGVSLEEILKKHHDMLYNLYENNNIPLQSYIRDLLLREYPEEEKKITAVALLTYSNELSLVFKNNLEDKKFRENKPLVNAFATFFVVYFLELVSSKYISMSSDSSINTILSTLPGFLSLGVYGFYKFFKKEDKLLS